MRAVERKLITILCTDVKGYSRLMDDDEVATLDKFRDYRNAISAFVDRHRGRVVHTSVDGLLAEFGSVIEAVQCAKKQNSYTGHYCLWDTGHKHRTTNCI